MLNDLLLTDSERFPFVLINFFTRESFLYKDINKLLRQIDSSNY